MLTCLALHSAASRQALQASKWLRVQLLLDEEEMKALWLHLAEPLSIYNVSSLCREGEEEVLPEAFFKAYGDYVRSLKAGELPDLTACATPFSSVWTRESEALFALPVRDDLRLVRVKLPVLQWQHHSFAFSLGERKLRSMIHGEATVAWGLQVSYPQIYQDAESQKIITLNDESVPNTALFRKLQRWLRKHSLATPLLVEGERINASIRLGKSCFSWINKHPQLAKVGIQVLVK